MRPELERAARSGDASAVAALLDQGVDVDSLDRHGQTALMLAIVAGHEATGRILVRAGAGLGLRGTGAPGFIGKTAMDLAAELGMTGLCADIAARRSSHA